MLATVISKASEPSQPYRTLKIDPEFKNLIPPLSDEEKAQLEANLKEFGCLDPLIIQKGTGILLDGHNRYEICARVSKKRSQPEPTITFCFPSPSHALNPESMVLDQTR